MNVKRFMLAGLAVLALLVGFAGTASAQGADPADRPGAVLRGTLSAISGSTLTLTAPTGTVTVVTDTNTRFRIPDVENAGLDDLEVGDAIAAVGWWEQEGATFHAFGVKRLPAEAPARLSGTVTAISGDTLTLETPRGAATVRVTDETVYHVQGVEQPGLSDVQAGQVVAAAGTLEPDGTLVARHVTVRAPREGRVVGQVLRVEGSTLTLQVQRGRELAVNTDAQTAFQVPGVESPTLADVGEGDRVAAEGTLNPDGTAHAALVVVLPEDIARLAGRVTAVGSDSLTLETPGGAVTVRVGDQTLIRIPGIDAPVMADVEVGDTVRAAGVWQDAGTFEASGLQVVGGRREGAPARATGRVIEVGSDSLTLGTPHGPVVVRVDTETHYRVPDVENPSLADFSAGDPAGARGTWNADGSLQADGVAVLQPQGVRQRLQQALPQVRQAGGVGQRLRQAVRTLLNAAPQQP